jgi:hypothetical protein
MLAHVEGDGSRGDALLEEPLEPRKDVGDASADDDCDASPWCGEGPGDVEEEDRNDGRASQMPIGM